MADVVFVAVILTFFAVCLGLVKACDRLVGPDQTSSSGAGAPDAAAEEVPQ